MWFLFGFVTLAAACVSSLIWRRTVSWSGETENAQGIPFEYEASTTKKKVRLIRVGVPCGPGFSLSLKPEGSMDRASKAIGLTKECQTGDAAFDDAIYVLSDDLVFHRMLQLDQKLRANVLRLVEICDVVGRLKAIHVHKGRIWVVVDPDTTDRDKAKDAGRDIVPALNHLAQDFAERPGAARDERDPFPFRAACVLGISTGLAINGGIGLVRAYPGDFPYMLNALAPLPFAVALGFAGIIGLIVCALWFMGRSSRTHLVLIELLLVGTFGAIASAYMELRDYNMEYDANPPNVHQATVTETWETYTRRRRGGKTRHCHVALLGWPSETATTRREMSCGFYARVHVGTRLDIQLRTGALGWPWIADYVIR
jgi:hypothetical protein